MVESRVFAINVYEGTIVLPAINVPIYTVIRIFIVG